jgi:DNA-binding MarR family transcriptional regulator
MTASEELSPLSDEHAELWLTPDQLASWLSLVRLITRLPWAMDVQLQRDADLSMIEYSAMARLSNAPQQTIRMSDLAEFTSSSLSRLSHLVKRLESRGYVRREADRTDGRGRPVRCRRAGHCLPVILRHSHAFPGPRARFLVTCDLHLLDKVTDLVR